MRIISERQRKDIGEFFERVRDTAQRCFERDGFCTPVAILMRDGEDAVIPLGKLINHKEAASLVLNKLIETAQPLAFVFITEAWMASAYELPRNPDGSLTDIEKKYGGSLTEGKDKPKKGVKEVVMLQCSAVTGESFMLSADIVRAEGAKPTLKPWVRAENDKAEGRFIFDVTPLAERQ